MNHDVTYIGRTNARNDRRVFGIKQSDRLLHLYIVGKTGTGKTTLIESMARQDLAAGRGFALIDPHGDLVDRVFRAVPQSHRINVTYINAPDPVQPFGYNPLRHVRHDKIPLAAAGLLEAMKKLWTDAWGVRMEHILRNALYALLERDGSTLSDILRLLNDKEYRRGVARSLGNDQVKSFWLKEFSLYSDRYRVDSIAPVQNKVGALLADPTLRRIFTNSERDIRIRRIMDEGGVLLVNLAKGRMGEDSSTLLGAMLVSTIGLAAFSRAEVPDRERQPFHVYIDEFQSFTTLSLANMLSELRKYGVGLTVAHQHLEQLEPEIRSAVIGNVATIICFRAGAEDAAFLAKHFQPQITPLDVLNLPNHHIYLRLMIDGSPSPPFSAETLRPEEYPNAPGIHASAQQT